MLVCLKIIFLNVLFGNMGVFMVVGYVNSFCKRFCLVGIRLEVMLLIVK